jgi:hypothetical protein
MMPITKESLLIKLLPKVILVMSKRDSRLGIIIGRSNTHLLVKMENIQVPLKLDFDTMVKGFNFSTNKSESIVSWYKVKYKKGLVYKLSTEKHIYYSTILIYDEFQLLGLDISNHKIFTTLESLRLDYQINSKQFNNVK